MSLPVRPLFRARGMELITLVCPRAHSRQTLPRRCRVVAHIMKLCPQNYKRAIIEQAVLFELLASNAFLSLRTHTRYDCAWASRPYLPVVNLQIIV